MLNYTSNKGITLIALIITIIVMLILVAVTISMAINGGLFEKAGEAVGAMKNAINTEQQLANGRIKIGDLWYASIDDYLNNNPITTGIIIDKPTLELKKKYSAEEEGEEILTGTLTASLIGMETEPEISWEVSPADQTAVTLSGTKGKTITVTAVGTAEATVTITAKCTYEGTEYTVPCEVKLKILKVASYAEAAKDTNGFLTEKATYASDGYTAVIPKGFKISEVTGEQAIGTGLVIKDANNNEFVWIPVAGELGSSYSSETDVSEPTEMTDNFSSSSAAYDSQATLDYLYGENYYNYAEDFKYADEYAEMVEKVNANHGFYIGRYETTIDSDGSIGTKSNTTVLTAGTKYKYNATTYYYRWYGLYYASKNANVTGNGTDVQTAMIYGVLWDKAMDFIRTQKTAGKTTYNVDLATSTWHGYSNNGHSSVVKSGQANPGTTGDVALNIWDLEGNAREWTQEAESCGKRVCRGGLFNVVTRASDRTSYNPILSETYRSSRLAFYIK